MGFAGIDGWNQRLHPRLNYQFTEVMLPDADVKYMGSIESYAAFMEKLVADNLNGCYLMNLINTELDPDAARTPDVVIAVVLRGRYTIILECHEHQSLPFKAEALDRCGGNEDQNCMGVVEVYKVSRRTVRRKRIRRRVPPTPSEDSSSGGDLVPVLS